MKRHLLLNIAVLSFGLLSAQSDTVSDSLSIDNVIVTHSKVPLSISNSSKPVKVIGKDALKRSPGADLSQILNESVGINVVGSLSNPGKDKSVFVRGASGEYTVILLNGQPVLDPSGLGGVADLRSISTNDIERIEILKGTQSVTYGSDALAGVINVITTSKADNSVNGHAQMAYGSFNSIDLGAGISGRTDQLSYRVNASRESSDGISEAFDNGMGAEFDNDEFQRNSISAGLGFQLSPQLKWDAYGIYSDYEAQTDAGAFQDSEISLYETELLNFGTSLNFESDKFRGAVKYTQTQTDRNFISDFGPFPFFGRFNNIDAWGSLPISDNVSVIGGLNFQNHKMLDEFAVEVDPNEQITSPYATIIGQLTERTNFEAGVRYNNHSKFGSNTNFQIAFSHWITNSFKAFANYGTGFKAPNLFQLYGSFGANPDLKPQVSQSFEIGITSQTIGGLITPQVTYFNRRVEDVIAFGLTYINQDEQRDQGVEIETGYYLGEKILIKLQYTYLTGEVSTTDFSGIPQIFNNLYRRPKHQYDLALFVNVTDELQLDISMQNVGERTDIFFNPVDFSQEEVFLESYLYASAKASYNVNDDLRVFLDVKNLFDADFQEVYGFTTPGINFKIGASYQFK